MYKKKSPCASLVRQDPTVSFAQGPKIPSYATGSMASQATKPLLRQAATVQCLEQLSEELIPRLMYHLPPPPTALMRTN